MALIGFGTVVTQARGSASGTVYSRNKGGAYIRGRIAPLNPRSAAQRLVRTNFATNAKVWSGTLTIAERAAWTFFAQANPLVNILGASIIISGMSMMMKLNQILSQIGSAIQTTPPTDLAVPALSAVLSVAAHSGLQTVVLTTAAQATNDPAKYYIFASKPLPPGKTASSSNYRYLTAYEPVAAATSISLSTLYIAKFGAIVSGQAVFVLVATVNATTGAVTPGLIFQTAVT